jgi:hypothetical protein
MRDLTLFWVAIPIWIRWVPPGSRFGLFSNVWWSAERLQKSLFLASFVSFGKVLPIQAG